MVDLCRRANLLNLPAIEHDDFLTECHGLGLIMRNVNHGRAQPPMEPDELDKHVGAQGRVEIRERLVEKKQLGPAHDGAPERHSLSLPPAQLLRFAVQLATELQQARDLSDPLLYFFLRCTAQ